jgi:hypothetical protein
MRQWNDVARLVRELVVELLDARFPRRVGDFTVPGSVRKHVEWDIGQIVMVSEYADVARSPFFDRVTDAYLCGLLPCGWQGTLQSGRVIAF